MQENSRGFSLFEFYCYHNGIYTENFRGMTSDSDRRPLDKVTFPSTHNQMMFTKKWVAIFDKKESLLVDPAGLFFHFLTSYRLNNR